MWRYQRLVFRHKLYQLREERDMKPETFASLVSALLYEKRFLLYQTPGYLLLNMSNLLPGFIWGLHVFHAILLMICSAVPTSCLKKSLSWVLSFYIVLHILFENINTNGFLIDSSYLLTSLLLLLECVKTWFGHSTLAKYLFPISSGNFYN